MAKYLKAHPIWIEFCLSPKLLPQSLMAIIVLKHTIPILMSLKEFSIIEHNFPEQLQISLRSIKGKNRSITHLGLASSMASIKKWYLFGYDLQMK